MSKDLLAFPVQNQMHVAVEFATGCKQYTYRVADLTIKQGDYAVVQVLNDDRGVDGYKVVRVMTDPYPARELSSIQYKWIVAKVDVAAFEERMRVEEEIRTELEELKTLARARQARKSLEDLLQGDEAAMARYQALLQKMGSK